ncbi:Gfo/Idh/MocA family oxidoreductase [Saccharococcus caldoxylosilyticus]|uniref:Gfo/Idh/MocA family protein n=1 Tax=Saccharococcus caldoxylosilyticus TaxID=81408 RepID=UPI001C4E09C2|nr:Gfo/Idh/MocA family oxidoreductase [Parageobacillus caldoxylosilyticus]QXJ39951.1 1,5-anhydro-D-fructose reductase [Parageobacillus caldoxylosilyticus]BDG43976.1 dehydrogenase [Parageobacillus caldoxylosilyticus]
MRKINVGIIGTGFSAVSHIEALRRLPQVQIVAIASSSQEKAVEKAKQFGIPKAYGDYDALIQDPEVEVVHNCTRNYLHFPINKAVLEAGKHLLSEKPLAINSKQSDELNELAKKSPVISAVCFNYRHYPLVAEVKEILARECSRVHLVYGGYVQDWLLYDTDYNWRLDPLQNGASRAIADIGSHWCDTVQYVLGKKITEVFADLKTVHPIRRKSKHQASTFASSNEKERENIYIDTEDCGSVLIHFEDGTHGVFTVSQVSAGRKNRLYFEIAADTATIAWDQEDPNRLWVGKRDEPNREIVRDPSILSPQAAALSHYPGGHQEGWPDGLKNLFLEFYAAVSERKAEKTETGHFSFATIEDGHQLMKLVDAILESHRLRKWVSIS